MNQKEERIRELNKPKPFKPSVEPSEPFAGDWENVNSPETYRLLTEARDYFLIKGVIKKRSFMVEVR